MWVQGQGGGVGKEALCGPGLPAWAVRQRQKRRGSRPFENPAVSARWAVPKRSSGSHGCRRSCWRTVGSRPGLQVPCHQRGAVLGAEGEREEGSGSWASSIPRKDLSLVIGAEVKLETKWASQEVDPWSPRAGASGGLGSGYKGLEFPLGWWKCSEIDGGSTTRPCMLVIHFEW